MRSNNEREGLSVALERAGIELGAMAKWTRTNRPAMYRKGYVAWEFLVQLAEHCGPRAAALFCAEAVGRGAMARESKLLAPGRSRRDELAAAG